MAVAAQISVAEVIGDKQQDIRRLAGAAGSRGRSGSQSGQGRASQSEEVSAVESGHRFSKLHYRIFSLFDESITGEH